MRLTMKSKYNLTLIFVNIVLLSFISGCVSSQSNSENISAKSSLTFIDLKKFDDELNESLGEIKEPVSVNFYTPLSPNDIPQRLQKWLTMVEKNGGKINIVSPEGEPTPKDPTIILGLFSSLWSAINSVGAEILNIKQERNTINRDANIALARNAQGVLYIQNIQFTPREYKK